MYIKSKIKSVCLDKNLLITREKSELSKSSGKSGSESCPFGKAIFKLIISYKTQPSDLYNYSSIK